ncbi:TPA: Ankyrin repeat domain-containing protein 17 [Trebouxia sp. C0006]
MLCKGSDRRRRTTNHQAVCSRNLSKIRKLLKTAGARELEACSARDDTSASKQSKASNKALHWAVTLIDPAMVDSLLQKAAKVDSAGDQEKTPLMLALELEDSAEKTKIVQKLMAKKASISAESFSGDTPVLIAVRAGSLATLKLLYRVNAKSTLTVAGANM